MKRLSFLISISFLSVLVATSCALAATQKVEVGPAVGYLLIEGDSDIDNALVLGGRFGVYVSEKWSGELSVLGGKSDVESTDKNVDLLLPTLEAQRHFPRKGKIWTPYLAAGGGLIQINRDRSLDENEIDSVMLYGGGVKWKFHPQFLARLDARHILNMDSGQGTNNALVSLGVSWIYGGEEEPVIEETPPPPPPVVPVVEPPKDSDADGVTDDVDECPATSSGTVVDSVGCPAHVNVMPEKEWVLTGVKFKSGSNELTSDSMQALEDAVEILKTHSNVRVEIQGNTDRTGSAEINNALSEKRALAVKTYLVGRGIEASRLETRGLGFTNPIDSNKTAEGRAKNRRIEFKILSR